jgi:hypothetical protein
VISPCDKYVHLVIPHIYATSACLCLLACPRVFGLCSPSPQSARVDRERAASGWAAREPLRCVCARSRGRLGHRVRHARASTPCKCDTPARASAGAPAAESALRAVQPRRLVAVRTFETFPIQNRDPKIIPAGQNPGTGGDPHWALPGLVREERSGFRGLRGPTSPRRPPVSQVPLLPARGASAARKALWGHRRARAPRRLSPVSYGPLCGGPLCSSKAAGNGASRWGSRWVASRLSARRIPAAVGGGCPVFVSGPGPWATPDGLCGRLAAGYTYHRSIWGQPRRRTPKGAPPEPALHPRGVRVTPGSGSVRSRCVRPFPPGELGSGGSRSPQGPTAGTAPPADSRGDHLSDSSLRNAPAAIRTAPRAPQR